MHLLQAWLNSLAIFLPHNLFSLLKNTWALAWRTYPILYKNYGLILGSYFALVIGLNWWRAQRAADIISKGVYDRNFLDKILGYSHILMLFLFLGVIYSIILAVWQALTHKAVTHTIKTYIYFLLFIAILFIIAMFCGLALSYLKINPDSRYYLDLFLDNIFSCIYISALFFVFYFQDSAKFGYSYKNAWKLFLDRLPFCLIVNIPILFLWKSPLLHLGRLMFPFYLKQNTTYSIFNDLSYLGGIILLVFPIALFALIYERRKLLQDAL